MIADGGFADAASSPAAARPGLQAHYAGSVSRLLAYAIDLGVSTGVFMIGLAGFSFVGWIVTGHAVKLNRSDVIVGILWVVWLGIYFAYSWAAGGKTPGMALLGVRVVSSTGADATGRQAVTRTLAFPLSFLVFGLGFFLMLVQRDRRALHDLIAGTAVVYDWDARAARLRFLARDHANTGT
ncbi:MAG TPA: RDD family protein [Streptosporangiaceae bacterium]|nr:RDD family protein [Streptosporangiaceae bacterium]